MRYLVQFSFLLMLVSCGRRDDMPSDILHPKQMQEVFWDFVRAEVYTNGFTKHDSAREEAIENLKLQEKIFKEHHITKEQFYKSYAYYSNHKELMSTMIDSILSRQEGNRKTRQPLNNEIE